MTKVRKISAYQATFSYSIYEKNLADYQKHFEQSDLGKLCKAIPWKSLIKTFGLKENVGPGPKSIFSPQGKIGLMFLKHYTGVSDRLLIEQLNGNIYYQLFCDMLIPVAAPIKCYKIVSSIRCALSASLNIDDLEAKLIAHWLPYMDNLDQICVDATCYESSVRYPTDVKLLWESVGLIYQYLKQLSQLVGKKVPRSKLSEIKKAYTTYIRQRNPRKTRTRSIKRRLLGLLDKYQRAIDELEANHPLLQLSEQYQVHRRTIKTVYNQQYAWFHHQEKPKNRIISLFKPYLRPIVRGKEKKPVEFGIKVNKIIIDGIGFIEHLSFEAFHEGIRLPQSIAKAQKLTQTKVRILGADGIYSTNDNRRLVKKLNIQTDFVRKGRAGKHEPSRKKMAKMIKKERVSRLEGSFGNDKEHYHLKKILARTQANEKLWLFFGIHTANAMQIGHRMSVVLANAA